MPVYKISVPNPTKTIYICVNKQTKYVTSFDASLAGETIQFDTRQLIDGDSVYYTKDKKQVIWRN